MSTLGFLGCFDNYSKIILDLIYDSCVIIHGLSMIIARLSQDVSTIIVGLFQDCSRLFWDDAKITPNYEGMILGFSQISKWD